MLSQVLLKSGVAPMTGNLNMNGFKIGGLGDATSDGDAVSFSQFNAGIEFSGVPTGAVQGFRTKSAPTGWLIEDGKTIGNGASGATGRANSDTETLFTHLWTQFTNTELPIQTSAGAASTRGSTAAADYAANKRLPLFDSRSRFLRGSDSGLAFDASLVPGLNQADALKNHVHPGNTTAGNRSVGGIEDIGGAQTGGAGARVVGSGTSTLNIPAIPFTTSNNTDGIALETRPRSSVVLYCIKL